MAFFGAFQPLRKSRLDTLRRPGPWVSTLNPLSIVQNKRPSLDKLCGRNQSPAGWLRENPISISLQAPAFYSKSTKHPLFWLNDIGLYQSIAFCPSRKIKPRLQVGAPLNFTRSGQRDWF